MGATLKSDFEAIRKNRVHEEVAKQIEALQNAAEKLREVAPLLAENEEDDNVVLAEMDEETAQPNAMAAKASASGGSAPTAKPSRPVAS